MRTSTLLPFRRRILPLLLVAAFALLALLPVASAHLGSPDIYLQATAGPYPVLISILPPTVIPGIAQIQVRTEAGDVSQVLVSTMPLTGEASLRPPSAEELARSQADPKFFTGTAWITAIGSWQVRIALRGGRGEGLVSVPLPSVATNVGKLQGGLRIFLVALGVLLLAGVVGITGAALRQAQLPSGASPSPRQNRRANIGMILVFILTIGALWFGERWWKEEAKVARSHIYQPLKMQTRLGEGSLLHLDLRPGANSGSVDPPLRPLDDLILDHGHLMHLYLVRQPQMDFVLHVHPAQTAAGLFDQRLPNMPAGLYRLYADIVHSDGFPETAVAALNLPQQQSSPPQGDDASGALPRLADSNLNATAAPLPDGYSIAFDRPKEIAARTGQLLTFHLLDPSGHPPADMTDYMGMAGHAAILKDDGSVFAHIHPSGSISMAALMMANPGATGSTAAAPQTMNMGSMAGMGRQMPPAGNEASFPYGFPASGDYRVIVQMKHGLVVETAAFDVLVAQ